MNLLPEPLLKLTLLRNEILNIKNSSPKRSLKLAVHRNHAFELIASVLNVFLAPSNMEATFFYSAYDDSLNSITSFPEVDAHIVWLDGQRYHLDSTEYLVNEINRLQSISKRPVLVAALNLKLPPKIGAEIKVCPLDEILDPLGEAKEDLRLAPFSGTRLSNQACLQIARYFGFHWLPEIFLPPLKALALDLDNTLYAGIVAEDGIDQLHPYIKVQEELKKLKQQGLMLTLLSKNEEVDILTLFKKRPDFPLKFEDFAAHAISWEPKPWGLKKLAQDLNINPDAFLFVDDNLGELAQMANTLPEVHLLAANTPEATLNGLRHYPGLRKSDCFFEDRLRTLDIQAQKERQELFRTRSVEEYRRELKIILTFNVNPETRCGRVTELLNKTNQFICTYLRPSLSQVQTYMADKDLVCITCSLEDKLSQSGLIAILLASRNKQLLNIDELVISCRALGRHLESGLIFKMLNLACNKLSCDLIKLNLVEGPRNTPARTWIHNEWPQDLNHPANLELFKDRLAGVQVKIT